MFKEYSISKCVTVSAIVRGKILFTMQLLVNTYIIYNLNIKTTQAHHTNLSFSHSHFMLYDSDWLIYDSMIVANGTQLSILH